MKCSKEMKWLQCKEDLRARAGMRILQMALLGMSRVVCLIKKPCSSLMLILKVVESGVVTVVVPPYVNN